MAAGRLNGRGLYAATTTDLERLSEALHKDTREKLLEKRIESQKEKIKETLDKGGEFVLDGERGIAIKKAS